MVNVISSEPKMNQEFRKKVLSNQFDKQQGSDYFADLLREPSRSAKVFKRIVFNERVHLIKIEEFEKRKVKLINSKFIEKNRLIERLNYYEEKIQLLKSQSKKRSSKIHLKLKSQHEQTDLPSNKTPVGFLTRSKSMLIEQENKARFNEIMLNESENLVEKKKTFFTSMEDFERETSSLSISILPTSARSRPSKKLNVRFKIDDQSNYRSKSFENNNSVHFILPKQQYLETKADPDSENKISDINIRKPSLKERFTIPKHINNILPIELGDYDLPIVSSKRL